MHPVRRRKKRPNYGVRTVEVARGKNGFGFTISGQQPCILSCIVSGSPAEKAGLRPGDYLVAVNGQSVSKLPHDDVVRLIGCLNGVLKLQIAENYYSDSSDEDNFTTVRSKPKFVHKSRNANTTHHSPNACQTNKTAKVRDLRASTIYNKFAIDGGVYPSHSGLHAGSWEFPELPPPRVLNVKTSSEGKEVLSFVIGYLGTIEMPKQIQPGCRPQVVRGCIKRLRTEKRSHSWVLLRVHADGVTVVGSGGKVLAEYPVNRITFCGTSSEEDKKYFGLVTVATGDGNEVLPSSSCHVFAVQANLFEHEKHSTKAVSFNVTCTTGALSQGCFEFPATSEPILNAIRSFCLTKDEGNVHVAQNEMLLANSPQPSHSGSTAASSNSDSGIGFRDESGNQSDRIVMVDVENQRLHIQQLYNNSKSLENSPNSLNIQLQASGSNSETSSSLQHAFAHVNTLCPLPVPLDSIYGSCSAGNHVRALPDSKVPASNRSRSPLLSSSPSSSDDEDKTLTKMAYLKGASSKTKSGRSVCAKGYEDSSKSLPSANLWYEKSIFYQLGLMPNKSSLHGRQKGIHNISYKMTSKSSENLDNASYYNQKTEPEESNIANSRMNSKSTDNLMQISGGSNHSSDVHSRSFNKLSPLVNISKCTTGQKLNSPLSISFGEGSVLHSNGDQKTRKQEGEDPLSFVCDKTGEVLLSYSMSPKRFFGGDSGLVKPVDRDSGLMAQTMFKSADDMSICSYKSNEALLTYKLSPKVFGMKRPLVTQSLEDLKGSYGVRLLSDQTLDPSKFQQWGSLQDLRSFETQSFESSLMPKDSGFAEKESSEDTRGPVTWANSFEKLLEDPSGLSAFAEFLKKEFSQENITFWISCEKYKSLEDESQRKKLAGQIFETHLGPGAMEPVNIDAQATQYAQEKLSEAPVDLFVPAQKQIFNLMKFDSYPRFIKSDLYKECLLTDLSNEELPYGGNIELPPNLQKAESGESANTPRGKLKKSRSDAEDCSRKSLLPWHKKNRSKSKDRGESEYKLSTLEPAKGDNNEDVVSVRSEITSSRSSLASWDLALRGSFSRQSITSGEASEKENCQLCRVILSDGATTVVRVRPKETVRELIHRLLEKRGLHYSAFESFVTGSSKPLSLDEEASALSNREIRVEQRILFRLDLPNRRTVSVKAKPSKNLGQVLRSVLHKYSYRLEAVAICSMSENEVLEMSLPVTAVDGRRLTVLTRSTDAWKSESAAGNHVSSSKTFVKSTSTLDEITNKVFEEVLQGKADVVAKSDQGSLKSEEWGSEHSSGVFSKFLRRDSTYHEKSKNKSRGGTSRQVVEGVVSMVTGKPPLIGKWKTGSKLTGKSESDELYEGLKRMQRNRLDDQRGTEINIELPDFLKDKENAPASGKKIRKFRREDGATTPKFYDMDPPQIEGSHEVVGASQTPARKASPPRAEKVVPNPSLKSSEANKSESSSAFLLGSSKKPDPSTGRPVSKPLTCKTYETPKSTTPIKGDLTALSDAARTPGKSEPPPLPPKPKYLPSKSVPWNLNNLNSRPPQEITNRGTNYLKPSDVKRDNKLARSRRTVYLDQPTSSFV